MSLPVAVQVYSVRDSAEANLADTLRKIKEMGYAGVEFAGLYGLSPEYVKGLCDGIGLVPLSAHIPLDEMIADPDKTFSDYAKIGCKYAAVPYVTPERRPGAEKFRETIETIAELGKTAKKYGITLLYHNHDFEFTKVDGEYGLDILYKEVSPEYLQTELDLCWVNVGGEEPASYLSKYAGRARILHLKDFYGEKSDDMYELIGIDKKAPKRPANFEFRPVGYGKQDFPKILAAAEKAGTEWVVVEQDNPSMGKTPLECAAMSREYLRSIGC